MNTMSGQDGSSTVAPTAVAPTAVARTAIPNAEARYLFQLTVRNAILGSVSSVIAANLTLAQAPPLLILGGWNRNESSLTNIFLETKVIGDGWSCNEEIQIEGFSWSIENNRGNVVSLDGTRGNVTSLLLPPCVLLPGEQYRASLTVFLSSLSSVTVSAHVRIQAMLLAWITGGVRRSASFDDFLVLDSSPSIIELNQNTSIAVSWNCSSESVPEVNGLPSCENFTESDSLRITLPPGSLPAGGYRFTLSLSAGEIGNTSSQPSLHSSYSQVVVIYPSSLPSVEINVRKNSRFHSVLIHEKLSIEAAIQTSRPAVAQWTVEYVTGTYGYIIYIYI